MQVFEGARGGLIKAWIDGVSLEDTARAQLDNIAPLPFIHKHIAVMPDAHWGNGTTVGSVIPTKGAIIPAAVGVDIGCGMIAQRTSLTASDLPDNLHAFRSEIERRIPHGRTNDGQSGDRGAWHDVPEPVQAVAKGFHEQLKPILEKHPKLSKGEGRISSQLATLGTGNHFIECCLDEAGRVWMMLHSGSRGMGASIGTYFINLAKEDMRKWFINLPDKELAYLPQGTDHFSDYMQAMSLMQRFAFANRKLMMDAAMAALRSQFPDRDIETDQEAINCHHNYVNQEHHFGADVFLTRKGAISLADGRLGIIPGSMGAKSFIVRGKPSKELAESFCTCSHGAGRSMSRTEAKRRFTMADHAAAVAGVECRLDEDVIDETPMAYKDIDAVMAAQADHVEIVHTLKQVVCVKG